MNEVGIKPTFHAFVTTRRILTPLTTMYPALPRSHPRTRNRPRRILGRSSTAVLLQALYLPERPSLNAVASTQAPGPSQPCNGTSCQRSFLLPRDASSDRASDIQIAQTTYDGHPILLELFIRERGRFRVVREAHLYQCLPDGAPDLIQRNVPILTEVVSLPSVPRSPVALQDSVEQDYVLVRHYGPECRWVW